GTTSKGVITVGIDPRTKTPQDDPRYFKDTLPLGSVTALAFSGDGRKLVATSSTPEARVYDVTDRGIKSPTTVGGQRQGTFLLVAISPDGRWRMAGASTNSAYLWEIDKISREPLELPGLVAAITAVALGNEGKTAYTGHRDGKIRCWNVARL